MQNFTTRRYIVILVNENTLASQSSRRFTRTKQEAMTLAERLAGDASEFFRQGESYGYAGPAGVVYIADPAPAGTY